MLRHIDVNILLYAHRVESPNHPRYKAWLQDLLSAGEPFGVSELVVCGFIRMTTNARIWEPSTTAEAFAFVERLINHPDCVSALPGARHLDIFRELCSALRTVGPEATDAYLAALAIEARAEFVTADAGFARFPGLRWRHPFS